MVKVTYQPGEGGPESTTAYGKNFEKGKSVDITDEAMLAKARNNPYFKVAGAGAKDQATPASAAKAAGEARRAEPVTPKDAAHPPMFPAAHLKQEVQPTGTVMPDEPLAETGNDRDSPKRGKR